MKDNRLNSIKNTLLISLLMFTLWSCKNDDNEIVKRNWELVWQDEFNTPGAPDAAKGTYDIGNGPNNDGWGNAELQSYTSRAENIVIADGNLKITAIKNGNSFTSARIKTQGLFEQGYGRIEASIKLPYGPGIWPAFWMIGNDVNTKGWPQCGEIDIMEEVRNPTSFTVLFTDRVIRPVQPLLPAMDYKMPVLIPIITCLLWNGQKTASIFMWTMCFTVELHPKK